MKAVWSAGMVALVLVAQGAIAQEYVNEGRVIDDEHQEKLNKFGTLHERMMSRKKGSVGYGYAMIPHYKSPLAYHYRPAYHYPSNHGLTAYGWWYGRGGYNTGLPYGYMPSEGRLDYTQYTPGVKNSTMSTYYGQPEGYPYKSTYLRLNSPDHLGHADLSGYPDHRYYSYSQFGGYCPPGSTNSSW